MKTLRIIDDARTAIAAARREGKTIGLVPTMGFLHEGHLSLVDLARSEGAGFVVVSIFVNPTQFGPKEDFKSYPRDEKRDCELLEKRNVDLVFAPEPQTIYPAGFGTSVRVGGVSEPLEGERRPGHFDGVATVVLKLFNIVEPDIAVFGRKDAQQCAVIDRIVRDLNLPVRLVFGETIREKDGLARSSRNAYLSEEERRIAPALARALHAGHAALENGARNAQDVERAMQSELARTPEVQLDYLSLVDPETFRTPDSLENEMLLVGAARVGKTRLIDNLRVKRGRS